jgi:hypothetical protein
MKPQIIDSLPADEYHQRPELSASGMKILATKTPAHFRWAMDHEEHKDEFDFGTATHSLVLEEDTSGVEVLDFPDWRTKDAREARAAVYADGRTPILAKDWAGIKAMRDSIAAHPLARLALSGGHAERTIIFEHGTGVGVRARLDKHIPDSPIGPVIVDLKALVSADPREFGKAAANYGYHQQDANYRDAAKAATGDDHSMLFVLVEKAPPYLVSVVELSPEFVGLGRRLNDKAARIFADCTAAGHWPGYPASDPIDAPTWAQYAMEDLLK